MDYVCSGIREGFRVGYDYQKSVTKQKSVNMRSVEEHRGVVEEYIHRVSGWKATRAL